MAPAIGWVWAGPQLIAPSRLGRSFRWRLASSWVTNFGDGITLAAGPLLVASQTRDPLAMAMAAFLQRLRPDDGTTGTGQYAVRMLVIPR